MSDGFGSDYISVTDDDGNEFELEHIDTLEDGGHTYVVFLPADIDVDNESYGVIILKVVEENGEELLHTIDDEEELQRIHARYMERLFDEDDEE